MFALWQQPIQAWSIADFLVLVLVIVGCIGVTLIVLRVCDVSIPQWVWQIGLIVFAVFLGILAIRMLTSM